MALVVDTSTVAPGHRAAAVHSAVERSVAPSELGFDARDDAVAYRLEFWQVGGLVVSRAGGSAVRMRRTAAQVRRCAPEELNFGIQIRGRGRVRQGQRVSISHPRQVLALDMTRGFEFGMSDGCRHATVSVAFEDLRLPVDLIRRSATSLRSSPLHALFVVHLLGLVSAADAIAETSAGVMAAASTVDLARAVLTSTGTDDLRRNGSVHETLAMRIEMFALRHLPDADLDANQIAVAHNISLRQLYKVWSSSHDVPLSEWIILERLSHARRDLDGPERSTVAAIARRWGFRDAAHFTRRFRRAYGTTPREWRQQASKKPLLREATGGGRSHSPCTVST